MDIDIEVHGIEDRYVQKIIRQAVVRGIKQSGELFPVDTINVNVFNSPFVVAEWGVAGQIRSANQISITVDLGNPNIRRPEFENRLAQTARHETGHATNLITSGCGFSTLGTSLIAEGAALYAEFNDNNSYEPPPYLVEDLIGSPLLAKLEARAQTIFDRKPYDFSTTHQAWFITGAPRYPQYVGYTLGAQMIVGWARASGQKIDQILKTDPAIILNATLDKKIGLNPHHSTQRGSFIPKRFFATAHCL